uniref:Integrase catalytic domain-containing protein n=1 Tax=Trichuris muris TaxID=70415 RepID=A0A5S6Q1P2_TRIMR
MPSIYTVTEDDILELYAWGDCLLIEKKNEAYNIIEFFEPLCMSSLLGKTDRCGLSDPFVCGHKKSYVEAGGSSASLTRLLSVLHKFEPSMLSEIFGLYRMWGHPVVDEVAGYRKVQEVGKREIIMEQIVLRLIYDCLVKEFCVNYIRLEGRWPRLTFSNPDTNRITQLYIRRQLSWIEKEGTTGYNDLASVFPLKNFEFDYCLDYTQILDDKAISTYNDHWDQVYDPTVAVPNIKAAAFVQSPFAFARAGDGRPRNVKALALVHLPWLFRASRAADAQIEEHYIRALPPNPAPFAFCLFAFRLLLLLLAINGFLFVGARTALTSYRGNMEPKRTGSPGDASLDVRLIPEYDGSSGQPISEWLDKLELVCRLRGVDDVTSVIPLRLAGGAFAVYSQLPIEHQRNAAKVKAVLRAAFEVDSFVAYERFVSRKLGPNELPDAFLADLRRLAALFGGVSEKALACAFVAGLPGSVRQLLRVGSRLEDLSLGDIVNRARAVLKDDFPVSLSDTCLGAAEPRRRQEQRMPDSASESEWKCSTECEQPSERTTGPPSRRSRGRRCRKPGKRLWGGGLGANLLPHSMLTKALPSVRLRIDGTPRNVLVDTGCSKCVAHVESCKRWTRRPVSLLAVDGKELRCQGTGIVSLEQNGGRRATVEAIIVNAKPLGFDFVLGMNGIEALGGVTVSKGRGVAYDPVTRVWSAAWKWTGGEGPAVLKNSVKEYSPSAWARASYEKELEKWIQKAWLVPYDCRRYGPVKGLIPLMAVVQRHKQKVRPVMDFRELNAHIEPFTAAADVCADKLRQWRRQGANVAMVDLKDAYLQVRVNEALWPYQTVEFRGRRYCLTRLGFGLNVAPLVLKAILNFVLSQDPAIKRGTSAYVDDILVNEDVIPASRVKEELERYGLECKSPERLADGARVLGLKVHSEHGRLMWTRGNAVGDVPQELTRRAVFAYCGELVGHLPVCGWLRVAAAFVKRSANAATKSWDEPIDDGTIGPLLKEIAARVKEHDPARGIWNVSGDRARIWVDASGVALGVALEVGGAIVEDASWLRRDDAQHINMAELDAVIRGLNLAIAWKMTIIELMTDSSTVYRWIADGLTGAKRLITAVHHAAGHPGVRRTSYFVRRADPTLNRSLVRRVVSECQVCQSIDPPPAKWERGSLEVPRVWQRVAIDITHCGSRPVLTLIDCGPSRFAIWRPLSLQTSAHVIEQLESIFCERGAPEELLLDNDTAFRSRSFTVFAARWGVRLRFRCAYVPSGNGIVERCHRSIKVIAARKDCSILEAVYLYNVTPRDDRSASSTPAAAVYRYDVRIREIDRPPEEDHPGAAPYVIGEKVWVRPAGARCVSKYGQGTVTGILSRHAVAVDGIPRHVRDLRHRTTSDESGEEVPPEGDPDDGLVLHFGRPEAQPMPADEEPPTRHSVSEQQTPSTGLRRSSRLHKVRSCPCCDT